ncbi:S-layer homology domain-containing protein [Paenibacillus septentrionalis]|uniref:S-layer homology domain-containing protein n=1 Tax=Paenibacillus septentrionalis TaxID=429342 RepID=A0ABW1V4Z2_9BACL
MKKPNALQKIAALLIAVALIFPSIGTSAVKAAAVPADSPLTSFDYFSAVYPQLNDENHILKTITYEDLVTIFESEGNFAILFGGAWSEETQADIRYINEVAKEYGIHTLYNFDIRLDGNELDISDSSSKYAHYYVDLVNEYLTNIETLLDPAVENVSYVQNGGAEIAASKLQAPFLFIYNKNHQVEGASAPIVASLEKHNVDESYDRNYFNSAEGGLDQEKVDAYKAQVLDVFSKVNAADYTTLTCWEFIGNAFNQTFWSERPALNPANAEDGKGITIFDRAEGNYSVFEHVTYHELTQILASDGNYVILFGGSWCPNTQANINYIGQYAKEHSIDRIYLWDTKLTAGVDIASSIHPHNNEELQVRADHHDYAKLYGNVVTQYLTNITTQNSSTNPPRVITYADDQGNTATAARLQVPFLFAYNKANINGTNEASAPILGHVELMYSLTSAASNVAPDYDFGNGIEAGFNNKQLVIALQSLYSRLEAIPTHLTGVAPTSSSNTNGKITGTANKALEYKRAGADDSTYIAVNGDAIENLAAGTYTVRYRAKYGYQGPVTRTGEPIEPTAVLYEAGPAIDVVVPAYQGTTPTTPTTPVAPTPTAEPTEPVEQPLNPKAELIVSSEVDAATGEAVAVVTENKLQELVDHAIKVEKSGREATVVFTIEGNASSSSTQLTLPRTAFKNLAATDAIVQIHAGYGSISFDAQSIASIQASSYEGDISIIIAKSSLTEEGKQVLGDRPVYSLSVFAGTDAISSFGGGKAHVSLPYSLQANEDPRAIIVYHITDRGEIVTVRGNYDAASKSVQFSTSHFSDYIIGYNYVTFADVPVGAWYKDAVTYLAAREITTGTTADQYSPHTEVTRGQFIVLLLKAYGIEVDVNTANNFVDGGTTYYTPYLATAKKLGIATGTGDNKFEPNKHISRQDLFTLLHRALDVLGELPSTSSTSGLSTYADADQVAPYAQEALQVFVESGTLQGHNNQLNPKGNATRAELAQVLYRLLSIK